MTIDLKVNENSDYLHYVASGTFEPSMYSTDHFLELLARCTSCGISNVLFDFRNMLGVTKSADRIEFFFKITELHAGYLKFGGDPIRVAFLGDVELIGEGSKMQKFAAGRGFSTYVTPSFNAALSWLRELKLADQNHRVLSQPKIWT